MLSNSMCIDLFHYPRISDESLSALINNRHKKRREIDESYGKWNEKNEKNLQSSIKLFCEALVDQLSSHSDSSSCSEKTVNFHGIVIKKANYIKCIPRLTQFIKSHTNNYSLEFPVHTSNFLKGIYTANDEDDLDTIFSSLCYREIYSFRECLFGSMDSEQNETKLNLNIDPLSAGITFKSPQTISDSPVSNSRTATTERKNSEKAKAEVSETDLVDENLLICLSHYETGDHDLSDYLLNMSISEENKDTSISLPEPDTSKHTEAAKTSEVEAQAKSAADDNFEKGNNFQKTTESCSCPDKARNLSTTIVEIDIASLGTSSSSNSSTTDEDDEVSALSNEGNKFWGVLKNLIEETNNATGCKVPVIEISDEDVPDTTVCNCKTEITKIITPKSEDVEDEIEIIDLEKITELEEEELLAEIRSEASPEKYNQDDVDENANIYNNVKDDSSCNKVKSRSVYIENDQEAKAESSSLKGNLQNESNDNRNNIETSCSSEEVKPYQKPFMSINKMENADIYDPKWDIIRKLETDEERYLTVRKLWKNVIVPDPNENLTYHGYRKRRRKEENDKTSNNASACQSVKRTREKDDDCDFPKGKRARIFKDLSFNEKAIDKTIDTLRLDYEKEMSDVRLNDISRRKIDHRFHEYLNQLSNARKETEIIHKFYTGLPNQKTLTQKEIEQEQWDIEQVYNLFKRFYKWSGKVFNPVVNRR